MAGQAASQMAGKPGRPLAPRIATGSQSRMSEADDTPRCKKRQRVVACQPCRQAKARCAGSEGGLRSCSRCQELSLSCVVGAQYKRITKRTMLSDIARQLELLKAAHTDDTGNLRNNNVVDAVCFPRSDIASSDSAVPSNRSTDGNGCSSESLYTGDPICVPPSTKSQLATATTCETASSFPALREQTIRSTTLSAAETQHLFQTYFAHYHPIFPVLQAPPSAEPADEGSRLLFWTIILTAARHDSLHFSLLDELVPAVQDLLWSTIARPPHTISSLQAMAILCVWPFPTSSMSLDTTYILAGSLKSAAMNAGMHQPYNISDFSRQRVTLEPHQRRELIKVWCCIYLAVESAAAMAGQEPYFTRDATIEKACDPANPLDLPKRIHCAIMTQLFCDKVQTVTAKVERQPGSSPEGMTISTLEGLDCQLLALESQLAHSKNGKLDMLHSPNDFHGLTGATDFFLLSTRFQLRSHWLFEDEESPARQNGVIQAYDDAIDLVTSLAAGQRTESAPFRYLPFSVYQLCFAVGVFISKISHSSYRPLLDVEKGRQALGICISLCKQCSVEDNDLPGRSTKLLAQVWNLHRGRPEAGLHRPFLSVKCRFLVSIVVDSLWLWREKYAGQVGNGAPTFPLPFMSPAFSDISSTTTSPNSRQPSDESSPMWRDSSSSNDQSPGTTTLVEPLTVGASAPYPTALGGQPHDSPPQANEAVSSEDESAIWDITTLNSYLMAFDKPAPYPDPIIEDDAAWLQALN